MSALHFCQDVSEVRLLHKGTKALMTKVLPHPDDMINCAASVKLHGMSVTSQMSAVETFASCHCFYIEAIGWR